MDMKKSYDEKSLKVFISHSSKDKEIANGVCDFLEQNGVKCFIAPRDIMPGEPYSKAIMDGIDCSEAMVLVASANAFSSQHVYREIERAVNRNIKIIVYNTDNATVPKEFEYFIMVNQWIDATKEKKYQDVFKAVAYQDENEDLKMGENPSLENPPQQTPMQNGQLQGTQPQNGQSQETQSQETQSQEIQQKPVDAGTLRNGKRRQILVGGLCAVAVILCICLYFILRNPDSKTNKESSDDKNITTDNITDTISQTTDQKIVDGETTAAELKNGDYKIGDEFEMGSYNDEPITWQVADINKDGSMLVISRDIISLKSYDAAESGVWNQFSDGSTFDHNQESTYTPDQLIAAKGSNDWKTSNIRSWLNSKDTKVEYTGAAPDGKALYDERTRYNKEEGFLKSFTEKELSYIQDTKVTAFSNILDTKNAEKGSQTIELQNGEFSDVPDLSNQYQYVVKDKVFLLSLEEVKKYLNDSKELKVEALVTQKALEQDKTKEYSSIITSQYEGYYPMLTRTSQPSSGNYIMCVFSKDYSTNDYFKTYAGTVYGIRPAMVVKFK